jgi:hypothetical protein
MLNPGATSGRGAKRRKNGRYSPNGARSPKGTRRVLALFAAVPVRSQQNGIIKKSPPVPVGGARSDEKRCLQVATQAL